ncbi:MAG TPA: rhomboid family intramembrane serine protease, partial [Phycisphaerales bacterium]|nr:rhomboid family intramembrane serine protease [Phycisphaerales bacterium]
MSAPEHGENPVPLVPAARRDAGRRLFRSFNTWLIIANLAVFLLNNMVLRQGHAVPHGLYEIGAPTAQQKARAMIYRGITHPVPGEPGIFYHPIVDPYALVHDPAEGARPAGIGQERFAYMPVLQALGHFSTGRALLWRDDWGNSIGLEVWRFVTFQFLHYDATHLILNMLGLIFVGGMVEERLGPRRYGAFYLTCGIFGALLYLLLNAVGWAIRDATGAEPSVPLLLFSDPFTPLIGASAGVFGVLMAAAKLNPRQIVDVFLIIPMRLRTAVLIFLALALLNLFRGGPNAGGDAAHVGGALAGAYFARRTHLLRDF